MSDIQIRHCDFGSKITLFPGDPYYDHLQKTNPKKLTRLVDAEHQRYLKTHAPGYNEKCHRIADEVDAEMDAIRKKKPDGKLLGLDTITEPLTKRDVKNAYRRAARKMHPDAGGSEEAFRQLHEAYRRVLAATKA